MKKTYVTNMPNHIGAFYKASKCFAELGVNITRVSYNKGGGFAHPFYRRGRDGRTVRTSEYQAFRYWVFTK